VLLKLYDIGHPGKKLVFFLDSRSRKVGFLVSVSSVTVFKSACGSLRGQQPSALPAEALAKNGPQLLG
jgi:hypothetical protein